MANKFIVISAALLGILALANGVFMILAPEPWYWLVPGVPDRGPFNQHFLRDIGIIYLLIGLAFSYGTVSSRHRFALWIFPSCWLLGHAIFHLWEVMVGICGPNALVEDFAGVTLPALVAITITLASFKSDE